MALFFWNLTISQNTSDVVLFYIGLIEYWLTLLSDDIHLHRIKVRWKNLYNIQFWLEFFWLALQIAGLRSLFSLIFQSKKYTNQFFKFSLLEVTKVIHKNFWFGLFCVNDFSYSSTLNLKNCFVYFFDWKIREIKDRKSNL